MIYWTISTNLVTLLVNGFSTKNNDLIQKKKKKFRMGILRL